MLKWQHSSATQLQAQLLHRKAEVEKELSAVNLALEQNAQTLHSSHWGLSNRRQEMNTVIQLFPPLRSRELIVREQMRHYNEFWAKLWQNVLDSLWNEMFLLTQMCFDLLFMFCVMILHSLCFPYNWIMRFQISAIYFLGMHIPI